MLLCLSGVRIVRRRPPLCTPLAAMATPLPSAGESSDALVQAASAAGDGPMLGDIAAVTTAATTAAATSSTSSSTGVGVGGGGGSSHLKRVHAANIYFGAHNVPKTDANYAKFAGQQKRTTGRGRGPEQRSRITELRSSRAHSWLWICLSCCIAEYIASHGGADPPTSLFSAPVENGASSGVAAAVGGVHGSPPPPASLEMSGGSSGGLSVADGVSDAALGLTSPSISGSPSASGVPSSSSGGVAPSSAQVSNVRNILMQCYKFTNPEQPSMKSQRLFEVQSTVMQLNGQHSSKPNLSVLQTNLMYHNTKPLSTGSSAAAAAAAAAARDAQNLSVMPPGKVQQQQMQLQEAYAAKRRAEELGNAASKARKTAQETTAAEQRTLAAAAAQSLHHGTPIASYPPTAQAQAQQRTKMPMQPQPPQQPNGMPIGRGPPVSSHLVPPGSTAATPLAADLEQLSRKVLARCQQSDAASPTLDSFRLVQRVHNIVQRRSGGSVRLVVDRSDSALDRSAAAIELLTVATETYLRNLIQAARAHRSRRLDASKSYLAVDVTSDPKAQLASLHKQEQERIARIKKHREIRAAQERKLVEKLQAKAQAGAGAAGAGAGAAPGVEKTKEEEAQAALLAKHEAAVAQVERTLRENRAAADAAAAAAAASAAGPVGAAAGGAAPASKSGLSEEEEYVRSMLSEALNPAPAASAAASAPTPSPTPPSAASSSAASSALPPSKFSGASASAASAMPPSQFNPHRLSAPGAGATAGTAASSSSVAAAAAAAAAAASSGGSGILLSDLLCAMESHSHLRKSSRFYQAQLALGAKRQQTQQQQLQQRMDSNHLVFSSPQPQQSSSSNDGGYAATY